jgi:hypothetical protein
MQGLGAVRIRVHWVGDVSVRYTSCKEMVMRCAMKLMCAGPVCGALALGLSSAGVVAQDDCVDLQLIGSYGDIDGSLYSTSGIYDDGYAYLLRPNGYQAELKIIDLHDPSSPELVQSYELSSSRGWGRQAVSDGVYYSTASGRLIRFRLDDGTALPEYHASDIVSRMVVQGDRVYLGFFDLDDNGAGGFEIVDVSDENNPVRIVSEAIEPVNAAGDVVDVDVDGTTLYITHNFLGLYRYDISDPASPRFLGRYTLNGAVYTSLSINGGVAYLATAHGGIEGLLTLDIGDPSEVLLVGTSLDEIPVQSGQDSSLGGNLLALSYRDLNELRIVDVRDPQFPEEVFVVDTRLHAPAFIDKETLVLMSSHGLRVYDLGAGFGGDCRPPVVMPCDMNGDGVLNWYDTAAFVQAYFDGRAVADFNGDGQLNRFDVSMFLQCYAAYGDL